jgi:Family of unknown function (DUF6058)
MSELDRYLAGHFLESELLAQRCEISTDALFQLIKEQLVPAPSYTVTESSRLSSFVFGQMEAKDSTNGQYFHPSTSVWIDRALDTISEWGHAEAHTKLKNQFACNLQTAFSECDRTIWRLKDTFTDTGSVIYEGLKTRTDSFWLHFLKGTFGLCVANPDSERAIMRKEILQEKLAELTQNGKKEHFTKPEAFEILALIDKYAEAAMPFSPIEYARSSRKTLVDDLRLRITKELENTN